MSSAAYGLLSAASRSLESTEGLVGSLAFSPADWADRLVRLIIEWFSGQVDPQLLGDAATLFLIGGLTMLMLVVCLVVLGSAFQRHPTPTDLAGRTSQYQLRPTPDGGWTTNDLKAVAQAPGASGLRREQIRPPVDVLVEQMIRAGLGEPRIIRHTRKQTRLRVYKCPGCAGEEYAARPAAVQEQVIGCSRQAEIVRRLFARRYSEKTAAVEIACRRGGHRACTFEVTH